MTFFQFLPAIEKELQGLVYQGAFDTWPLSEENAFRAYSMLCACYSPTEENLQEIFESQYDFPQPVIDILAAYINPPKQRVHEQIFVMMSRLIVGTDSVVISPSC